MHRLSKISIYVLVYLFFLSVSLVQFRSLLQYFTVSNISISTTVFSLHPLLGLIVPQVKERWVLSLYDLIYLIMSPLKPTLVSVNLGVYIFAASIAGFSFYMYSKELFHVLGFNTNIVQYVAILGGLFYMSNPFFFGGDLFWTGEIIVFSIFPFLLLSLHKAITAKSRNLYLFNFMIFILGLSFAIVEDSAHILTYGVVVLFLQVIISKSVTKINIFKSLLTVFAGFVIAALIDLPTFLYLFFQHFAGVVQFSYSGPFFPSFDGNWTNAMSPIWLIGDNTWFNRNPDFLFLGNPRVLINGTLILSFLLLFLSILSLFAARGMKRNKKFPLILLTAFFTVFLVFSNFGVVDIISNLPKTSNFAHIFGEGYIPEVIVALVYALLPEYLLLNIYKKKKEKSLEHNPIDSEFGTSFLKRKAPLVHRSSSPTERFMKFEGHYVILNLQKIRTPFVIFVLVVLVAAPIFAGFPSFFYSASPYNGVGNVVNVGPSTASSLNDVSVYLQQHPSGDVFWFPNPPDFGAQGAISARSYQYPYGSDGPFSTELFSYLVGNHPDSLINSGNYYSLAHISSLIGVKYFIFFGSSLSRASPMVNSNYFTVALSEPNAIILVNNLYQSQIQVSVNSVLVSGGLSTYSNFLSYESKFFKNYATPIPFMTDTYPFFNLTGNYSILATNISELQRSLEVMVSGYRFLSFPFKYIDSSSGWSGGDIADAGGYNWNGFAGSLPNYSWQSTYTVNDGVIYTNQAESVLSYPLSTFSGPSNLMVRVFEYPGEYTNLSLYIGNREFNLSLMPSSYAHFSWIELGNINISTNKTLIRLVSNGESAVNAIDLVPTPEWDSAIKSTSAILSNRTIYLLPHLKNTAVKTEVAVPPGTKYSVYINNSSTTPDIYLLNNNNPYILKNEYGKVVWANVPNEVNALKFNNTSRMAVKINDTIGESATVNAMIKPVNTSNNSEVIVSQWNSTSPQNFALSLNHMEPTFTLKAGGHDVNLVFPKKLTAGVWYYLTASFNNTIANLYINGTMVASEVHSQLTFSKDPFLSIGFESNTYPQHFFGIIASITIESQFYDSQFLYSGILHSEQNSSIFSLFFNSTKFNHEIFAQGTSCVELNASSIPPFLILTDNQLNYSTYPLLLNSSDGNILLASYQPKPNVLVEINPSASSSVHIYTNLITENTPDGPVVDSFTLNLGEHFHGNLYIIVSGISTETIIGGSYLKCSNERIQTIPAVGGAEGFIISRNATSPQNFKVFFVLRWYPSLKIFVENFVAYITLLAVLFTLVVALVNTYRKTRI